MSTGTGLGEVGHVTHVLFLFNLLRVGFSTAVTKNLDSYTGEQEE